jgi:RNA polymerase sigma factor (sigma-70 family)
MWYCIVCQPEQYQLVVLAEPGAVPGGNTKGGAQAAEESQEENTIERDEAPRTERAMLRVTTKASHRRALKSWMSPPPYIMNEELRWAGTEDHLFRDWPGPSTGAGRIAADEETLLFKQLHFCGYRLSKLYRAADKAPSPKIKRSYAEWVQRYHQIRTRLIEGNLGLVYDLIGRSRFDNLDHDEMSSEGMMALLRAADTFDPWRGYRFSTYACNAILRAFARSALHESKRRSKIAGPFEVDFEKSDFPEQKRADQRSLFTERLREVLRMDNAELTDVEKTVLARRFPMQEGRQRQTLEEIGRQMRVSKERVRQIQLSAIAKLRKTLAADLMLQ